MNRGMNTGTNRRSGALLVELVIALVILTVGLLGFFFSFHSTFRAGARTADLDDVRVVLDNVTEALKRSPFDALYANYNRASIAVPELRGPAGDPAQVQVTCFVNELTLPAEFGPVFDIDGRGGLDNPDCSSTYKVLPVRLSLTHAGDDGTETREVYLVLVDL